MQDYSFEKWMFGASVALIALMLLPVDAHAASGETISNIMFNPLIWLSALAVNYLIIKLVSSARPGI